MGQYQNLIFIALMVGAFYFLLIRPQQKRQQAQRDLLGALKPGDEVVTIGGIFATVVEVGDRILVRTVDGSELELAKQAIGSVIPADDDDDEEVADEDDEAPVEDDEPEAADEVVEVVSDDETPAQQ